MFSCSSPTPATSSTSPLSLHDALPILKRQHFVDLAIELADHSRRRSGGNHHAGPGFDDHVGKTRFDHRSLDRRDGSRQNRSEEHTSELQSLTNLVCRLLLEKKK